MTHEEKINPYSYKFTDTAFDTLMQNRIRKVLLICSNYDAFTLEEDGRINEQIFNEYVSLNLRYPPVFIQASNTIEAFKILQNEKIDLVITMLSVGGTDAFALAKEIKREYSYTPIVVLTHFSREIRLKIENEDLSAIDYVFSWLGDTNILLAIIKLIEDKMNVGHDVKEVGVQAILLIEDSIRFYSSYLPNIYKLVLQQAEKFMAEGVNQHIKTLRMRGRPKILLATTYEEAIYLYHKYKDNLLGIISDINYKHNGIRDKQAGFKIANKIRGYDKLIPILLQSSDIKNKQKAEEQGFAFIHKYSNTLLIELRKYLKRSLAFGDFVFRMPDNLDEIARANNLREFQKMILSIPEESLCYHSKKNSFSRWLNARALFQIAEIIRPLKPEDFKNRAELRAFIYNVIRNYRLSKGRGVISKFESKNFDEYIMFSRIGNGSIGGKARGIAFMDLIIKQNSLINKYDDTLITIPKTVVISTDIFDEFMESNDLYFLSLSEDSSDDEILNKFIESELPKSVLVDLVTVMNYTDKPLAIRSSSLLEDSHYQPFAGIYSTYMIPNSADKKEMFTNLTNSIKSVYASVFFKNSKSYFKATSNSLDEEKMSVVIQEICGTNHGKYYYPTFSGVARSINFYPIKPEKPEDGTASIAMGLGKYIVDGGMSLQFSPEYPKKIIQLSSTSAILKNTQKYFYAIDINSKPSTSTNDGINLDKLRITDDHLPVLKKIASTYDFQNQTIKHGTNYKGKRVLTFAPVLQFDKFPLAKILKDILNIFQQEIGNPIEMEFAVNLNTETGDNVFNLLQIRPIVEETDQKSLEIDNYNVEDCIIVSNNALGNGVIDDIVDFVYVKPEKFDPSVTKDLANQIEEINNEFIKENKNYILVGPGRWGSSDPWLGIPVQWSQISNARVIIESGLENFRIDPSQGTHFFQNLTSFRVGYFTIDPYINDGIYDLDFLNNEETIFENEYIRHIKFKNPAIIKIDGKNKKSIILKPVN